VELSTSDHDGAKRFYGALLGWEPEEWQVPGDFIYSMMRLQGEYVAGIQLKPEFQASLPPYWFNYVTVASADEAAARANECGGTVHVEPFDLRKSGRMAAIADPAGGTFGVWEPREHFGAGLVNEPGCLTWNELSTTNPAAAIEFYESLFGWSIEPIPTGDLPPYWSIGHEGAAGGRNGGIRELPEEHREEGVPSHWMPYFTVEAVDASIAIATEHGGANLAGPLDLQQARFAIIRDPQGGIFGIFEGDVDD
jgi:predicted enzyme related to lactoylglutathione lyase